MTKQTKILLGFGLVAVAGYLFWKQQQPKAAVVVVNDTPSVPLPPPPPIFKDPLPSVEKVLVSATNTSNLSGGGTFFSNEPSKLNY